MPNAVSSSLPGNLANFTGISPSSSTVVSPPLLSVPISYAVPPPASTLNPIFQPAIQAQTPLVHSAVPKQDSILQAAVNTPDSILQAARSEMDLQAEAVAQAQSRLRALTQAHAAAVGDVYARAQELASVGSLSASLAVPSPNQQLLMPPSAGLAAPGMFLPSGRAHPLPFVIGPGFLPVPDKTVMNIISGQYIDLASLLARPSDSLSPGPLVCLDGRVVVSAAPKPPRRLTDISQWLQVFAIYMLILIRYQLLILRTQSQFGGLAWYHYDEAFRRDAAARRVVDWSAMYVELYNFHTSIAMQAAAWLPVQQADTFMFAIFPGVAGPTDVLIAPTSHPVHQFRRLRPLPPSWRSFPHQHPLGLEVVDTVSDVLLCRTCLVSSAVCLFSACVRQFGLRYVCYMYIVIIIFFYLH